MATSSHILTTNDNIVLSAVFDPEGSGVISSGASLVNSSLPAAFPHTLAALLPALQAAEESIILPLNVANVSISQIESALSGINALISSNPKYPSAYNNRAQILRLLHGDDILSDCVHQRTIWNDLSRAILLATPETMEYGGQVCVIQAKVLAAAHMQKALLLLKASRVPSLLFKTRGKLPEALDGLDKVDIEEKACNEFELASVYGDPDAGKIATSLNPYAKLCGKIVGEAMKAELAKARTMS